jgi:peptide chain release factor subunit 1
VKCGSCDYIKEETMKVNEVTEFEQKVSTSGCPKCSVPSISVTDTQELIDELAEMAEQVGTDVEILSDETEEGQMLKKSFGGVAAILRYKAAV